MTEKNAGNAENLAVLRDRAKDLNIPNYQVKGYERLYPEVMAAQDKKADAEKELQVKERQATVKKQQVAKKKEKEGDAGLEQYPFTDPKTGRIGIYVLTDPRNTIPHTEKGTAFRFLRWM